MLQSGLTSNNTDELLSKPVMLSVRGEQRFEGLEPDATELTGMEGTITTFEVRDKRVTLTRSGKVNSQMVFEEGRAHTSLYETPFGELSVDIQTSRLRHNLTERGGVLDLRYSIAVEQTAAGENTVRLRVREKI